MVFKKIVPIAGNLVSPRFIFSSSRYFLSNCSVQRSTLFPTLLFGLFLFGMISSLNNTYADSTTSNVSVRVNGIDKLEISDGGTLTLDMASGSIALGPASDSTAVLSYVHNRVNNLKLSSEATIVNSPNPSNNDLILKISVQDGAGSRILYNDSGSTGPQDIVTGISAGPVSNKTVTYTAEGTANGTPIDEDIELSFTIMFTSLDE